MNRRAARVLIFNEHDCVLLFREFDSTTPEHLPWWCTPGGGLEPGETLHEAAIREVKEETGITLTSVSGPIYDEETDLTYEGVELHQYQQFVVAHVHEVAVSAEGWTDLEKRIMLESRWWKLSDLENTTETIYPENLAQLVRAELER